MTSALRKHRPALAAMAAALACAAVLTARASAQPAPPAPSLLLTIFLRHDQARPLPELNAQLEKNGWHQKFPPPGTEVVSWYVMMGIGQVVTLRVPAERLRDVNRSIENTAWGGYRTEFYPTYDFKAIADQMRAQMAGK